MGLPHTHTHTHKNVKKKRHITLSLVISTITDTCQLLNIICGINIKKIHVSSSTEPHVYVCWVILKRWHISLDNPKQLSKPVSSLKHIFHYMKSSISLFCSSKLTWYEAFSLQNLQSGKFAYEFSWTVQRVKINSV